MGLALAAMVSLLAAVGAAGQGSDATKVLVFHGGAANPSVDAGIAAITELGESNQFDVVATDDASAFTAQNLSGYRAVVALHSSGDVLDSSQQSALQSYVQGGGGFVGIGEAANLEPGEGFFGGLIGARPAASSSDAVTSQLVEVGDRVHPATRELPLEWGPLSDVWYSWEQNPTGQVHTVARARFGPTADDAFRNGSTSRPISWCRDFQGGRSFYTGMGRTPESFSEEGFRAHLLGAIQWSAGLVRGGCKATIAANYQTVRLSNGANGLATHGESHGVTVAPNGWAITIARAACGSNEERGARIGQASFPRTLDFTDPNVGVGCAPVHIFDPAEHDGTVNSGVTRAGTLTVYGDRGGGPEVNGKIETGGLGITASPDFAETGHIYVQYFPTFNPDNPVHPGLEDGAERRITKLGVGRVSRFTIDLETKQLDLASEVPIFEYDSQIYSCCHRGGGMGWDSEGNLYVTTGDSNSSGGNYSGNWQTVRCPTGDPDTVSNAHCGDNGISYRDARRTAGSTNDYNGKMLRINPVEGIEDGADVEIGIGSTYTLPTADSPNGPNLFSGTEGGGGLTKPEIYAMGLRNPSRLTIDPETDVPYSAWVGPDAGSPSASLGPSTYEVASQIPHAGNWGWPYCMGNKQAYRDRTPDPANEGNDPVRTTNAAGYVTGGPAGSPSEGWYDCDDLVNDSTNNTGLEVLPHNTGTGRDAGAVRPANLWYSRGNPGGDGCPVFPRDHGEGGAPNYAGTNTQLCPYYDNLGGHTIMSGPVYRYDEDAADDSVRWPEYWDGRWFVHDFSGGNAKSFGFLFDAETAAAGGQPSYVDKMSQFINWSGGSYMDSKYGPDGALYLQTYANYFEHGTNNGLHRVSYTGGADTPGPDPQWQSAGPDQIAFSIGRSGGVAYEWDFGDGSPTSSETDPTHAYAEPGQYDVTLTVTYADGEEASETVEVNATDDQTPPVTTHSLAPEEPGAEPVEVTLSATDPAGPDPEPQEHDVNARPSSWEPNALEIAHGDTVTWNFPSDAGPPHDVWLIAPDEAPDSQGTQITDGTVSAGGPPVSHTFEEAGSWTFVCKLHSFVQDGAWTGMTGTVDVGEDTGGGAASGVDSTEYRVNTDGATGEWQQSSNDGDADPFTTTFTVEDAGDHVVEYRSRDNAGNVEEIKSVEFTIEEEPTEPPAGACLPQSDEFGGTALDGKWDVLRPAGGGPQVADGSLGLEIRPGDFIANNPLAENALLQDAPDGEWTVTTRLDTSAIDANGEQAGLVIWKSESPNTFSKLVAIQSNAGNHQFEHIVTQNGSVSPPISQSITPAPDGQLPDQVLLRARSDGSQVVGEFSADDGETWTRVGQEGHAAPLTGDLRIGLAAFRGNNGGGTASFDWFRVHQGAEAGGPVECAVTCLTRSDSFDGPLSTARWSFRHPTTPATGERAPRTDGGNLVLPLGPSAVDQDRQGAIAFLGQPLPDGDFTVEAKINAPGLDGDDSGEESQYAQVGFGIYQTDDDWIGVYQTRNGDSGEPGTAGGTYFEVKSENEGSRSLGHRVGQAAGSVNLPDFWLRVTRTGDTITAAYSLDDPAAGGEWVELTTDEPLSLSGIFQAEEGPVHIGPLGVNGSVSPTFEYIRFDPDLDCPQGGCHPISDQFGGDELDPKWQILNPNPDSPPTVADGHLTLPVVPGDFYGGNGTAQALLQQAPAESWVATAKIAHANIDTNGEAAGLALVNSLDPNHFVKTAIQYKSDTGDGQPGKWAERVLTSGGSAVTLPGETVPWPNSGALELTGDYAWARFVYDAETQEITTWTSTDGTTFSRFGAAIPVDEYLSQPGGLRIGVFAKHDGSGDDEVQVDAFNVVAGTTDPQTPGDDCGAAGGQCPQTDEFDGDELDSKWEVVNPNPAGLSVGGGNLTLTTAPGDVFGANFTAQNIVLQEVPEGPWAATAKLDHTAITVNGQAAGVVIYGQEDPNHFAKTAIQYKDTWNGDPVNGIWVERILTTNGNLNGDYGGQFPNTGKIEPPTDHVWIRVSYDGENVITEYSLDGETWAEQAPPVPAAEYGANGVTKIGLFVKHDGSGPAADVDFDSFTVDAASCEEPGGDTSPPTTTHALDPESPDGGAGWYVSPVEVTLSATDDEGGSGVTATEYRFAGEEEWTPYDGPFTVSDDGRHEIEYRSTDAEGNTEAPRRVSLRIDSTDPTTTALLNGEQPVSNYDGPVEVDLSADDGDGSGVRQTEVRVDGGEWQPYVEEEVILDSAEDLEAWEQAGPGGLDWVEEEGGFARTFGGLGMPWYPKEYGDFSLKLQWRDSGSGSNGNSGVFARFPHPEETVDRPPAERYPCQVGSATGSPAWVAIYCGHEIQINDHQDSESQKTGSIYNFSPLNATEAKVQPKGTWVDYELRVVGQTYTIIRNGEVLQEFENAPDQSSSRPGDPPTNARQFARGYIGLQNHGSVDMIDFRNVRVLPLDEGSVRGPITVEGDGEHTVEYRSTDSAGNVEDVKDVTFTIGDGGDPDAPTVQGFADPSSGAAPLRVQFSATGLDPQGGRLTYEWRFGDGSGSFNQSPRHTYTAPGTYTATVIATDRQGKTGTDTVEIVVSEAGNQAPTVAAAADPIEGDAPLQVRFSARATDPDGPERAITYLWDFDDGGANAFGRNARHTYMEPGTYTATVTATDAGGAFDTATVEVVVEDPPGNRPPTVQAAATPRSGTAPLRVLFSSAATDPDGDSVSTVWDFGDGQQAGGPRIAHTYTTPGTYTATVTVTDPSGSTDTDSVQITVSGTTGAGATPFTPQLAPAVGGFPAQPQPQGDVEGESRTRRMVRAPKTRSVRKLVRRGLPLRVTCLERCRVRSVLRLSGERLGKSKRVRIAADRSRTVVVRLDRRVRRNLLAGMRQAGLRKFVATTVTKIRTADDKRTVRAKVTLKR